MDRVVEAVVLVLERRGLERVVGWSRWRRICRAVAAPAEQGIAGGGIVMLCSVRQLSAWECGKSTVSVSSLSNWCLFKVSSYPHVLDKVLVGLYAIQG